MMKATEKAHVEIGGRETGWTLIRCGRTGSRIGRHPGMLEGARGEVALVVESLVSFMCRSWRVMESGLILAVADVFHPFDDFSVE